MKTVFHPTLAGIAREVPANAVAEWVAAGWLKKQPETSPEPEPEHDPSADVEPDREGIQS